MTLIYELDPTILKTYLHKNELSRSKVLKFRALQTDALDQDHLPCHNVGGNDVNDNDTDYGASNFYFVSSAIKKQFTHVVCWKL